MAVRSRSLGFVADPVVGTFTTMYTVPAGRTAIVRHWTVVNRSGTAITFRLGVRTGGVTRQIYVGALAGLSTVDRPDCNLVLDPGSDLQVLVPSGEPHASIHAAAFGSLLLGAPE